LCLEVDLNNISNNKNKIEEEIDDVLNTAMPNKFMLYVQANNLIGWAKRNHGPVIGWSSVDSNRGNLNL